MAQSIPRSFNDAWETGKQHFSEYRQPISRFLNKGEQLRDDEDGYPAGQNATNTTGDEGTNVYAYDQTADGMQVHANKVLQLAILANIGFMIVFGIRCNFGAAKNHMFKNYTDPWGHHHVHDFNWTRAELSVMESSFFYGYLVTQIPAGFLAAKYPPNKLFGIAIGVASFLNVLLPYGFRSKSDTLVAVIQILQGLVQGVAYPSMHGVWRYWAPPLERSKLATTAFTGSYAGIAGCVWAIFWFSLTFEKPAFHPTITQDEKKFIEDAIGHVSSTHPTFRSIPWKAIVTSKPVWAIIVANFARSWTFYLLLQNQLTYMKEALDMNISSSGMLAALPHAVMGIVVLVGGFGGEALFMLIVAYTNKESTAVLALVLAVGCSGFAISGFNVNHLDIAPRYAAILMGFSNGIGTLAGLTCPIVTEKFTESGPHGWVKVFLLASLIHFTGVTFYAIYASGELQDWAEPKPEEESWNVTALNHRGSTGRSSTDQGNSSATNPFTAAWNESTQPSSSPYQQSW
ncbi:unnamed protein product [Nippostrongylus brasiliensis]|uniref:Probable vesicular glutamate transporter eat-4 (inferred by orthology to a C. elegans protein) n=1 Tax=Nippostrongylus brasiliensis TaxID=27835 RepID=A0A158R2A5_NIPBR|nr:unnamed protein product [Nippostrongylus brasiliensis]